MKYFLFSLLFLTGCSTNSFTRIGNSPVCLIKYQDKVINCIYENIQDCREQYGKQTQMSICFFNKDLKLKGGY